ncbi:hypothetical protein LUZ60_000025 [Juncus effusus]|nr:hypothetical protein LUZ60_000025 [Juncus effusus]
MELNKMTISTITTFIISLALISSPSSAQTPPAPFIFSPSPFGSPTPSPAPSPSIHHVNLTDLLTVAGPFHTFLSYLLQTQVIETFQSQANDSKSGGLTLYVPSDSAFASLRKSTLSNLTNDELKTLLLYHAFPRYYTLSDFKYLSAQNPVTTFAGGSYTLNVTYDMGTIHIVSSWFKAEIISSVYSTAPVAVYVLDMVLFPKEIFTVEPALAPVPAPPPESKAADVAPGTSVSQLSPAGSSESDRTKSSSSNDVRIGLLGYLIVIFSFFLVRI